MLSHVTHDRDLAGGNVAASITTQDGTRIERVHVRVNDRVRADLRVLRSG